RVRQLPPAQARAAEGPQSEDGRQGRRAAEESAVFQAGQGAEGADQQGAGAAGELAFRHAARRARGVVERLWAPWRLAYVTGAGSPAAGCIFCNVAEPGRADLIVARGRVAFVILNLYPYNNGHLMVVPNRHVPNLASLTGDEQAELMQL